MAKASKKSASQHESAEGFEGHYAEVADHTVGFETYTSDFDMAPLFKGLPDDRCQAPHWGYVLKGKLGYRTARGEEVIEAGEAYYVQPGHTPVLYAGTEVVEFTPTKELAKTLEVVNRNMAAAPTGSP
ncbi:hypothetical protein BH18CHL2_BH18CHL2_09900 [soil metagenome]